MRGISGVTGAGPIFRATMLRLHQNHHTTWFSQPDGIVKCHIHSQTGKISPTATENTITLCLPADNMPMPIQDHDLSDSGKILLDARYREWLEKEGDQARFAIIDTTTPPAYRSTPLRILSPSREAKYLLDPDLPGLGKQLRLSTDFPGVTAWSSTTLEIITENGQSTATLTPGTHEITLTDSSGRQTSRSIRVEQL